MASPKKATEASVEEKQDAEVIHNEGAQEELAEALGGELAEESQASTTFEAVLRAQVKAKVGGGAATRLRAVPNPELGADQVTIAGRTWGSAPGGDPLPGDPFVTPDEFKLLQEFTDDETGKPLLTAQSEVSA